MTEADFTHKVNAILTKDYGVYCEKMFNPMRGGTPDCWYSKKGHPDSWVEFKYHKTLPVRGRDVGCSELQKRWLLARHEEGRKVFVLVGTPEGVALLWVPYLAQQGWMCYSREFDTGKNVSRIAANKLANFMDWSLEVKSNAHKQG